MNDRPVTELIPELANEVTTLVKREGDLLRAELGEKVHQVESGIGSMAAGAVCLIAALVILLQAIVVALVNAGLGAGWASLVVGATAAVVGAIFIIYGGGNLKNLSPRRTMEEARRTAQMAREKTR